VSGVGGDAARCLGGGLEQQAVEHGLVVSGQFTDRRRQQVGLARLQQRRAALFDGRHDLELTETEVPACLRRHAGPWARKISATSRAGRGIPAASGGWSQRLQEAGDFAQ
jgi:hypothetical protein